MKQKKEARAAAKLDVIQKTDFTKDYLKLRQEKQKKKGESESKTPVRTPTRKEEAVDLATLPM